MTYFLYCHYYLLINNSIHVHLILRVSSWWNSPFFFTDCVAFIFAEQILLPFASSWWCTTQNMYLNVLGLMPTSVSTVILIHNKLMYESLPHSPCFTLLNNVSIKFCSCEKKPCCSCEYLSFYQFILCENPSSLDSDVAVNQVALSPGLTEKVTTEKYSRFLQVLGLSFLFWL